SASAFGTDVYVPAYVVRLDGVGLTPEQAGDVLSVTYTDALDSVDTCTLELNNWNPDKRELKYVENGKFAPGKRVQLDLGYLNHTLPVFDGRVTTLALRYPASGAPTLRVSAA